MGGRKVSVGYFPTLPYEIDKAMRKAYRGGITYLNPKYAGKIITSGKVYDENSIYPYIMRNYKLPYGTPLAFEGKYIENEGYPLYIQILSCQFKLKGGCMPNIQIKRSMYYKENEYLEDSGEEAPVLYLTNYDLEIFFDSYYVYNIEYKGGWCFKSEILFEDYINKWYAIKTESKKTKNFGMYTLSKLMQNALYGRFGLNPEYKNKYPVYDKIEDKVIYELTDLRIREGIYLPLAIFVTSIGRFKLVKAVNKIYDKFVYCDTDSIHLHCDKGYRPPINVDDYELGAWKNETIIEMGKYIKQKTYIEYGYEPNNKYNKEKIVKCAGMKDDLKIKVNFHNFSMGRIYKGNLKNKRVRGGMILKEGEYKIK